MEIGNRVELKNNMSQHVFVVSYIFSVAIKNTKEDIIAQKGDVIIINENDASDKRVFHITQLSKI